MTSIPNVFSASDNAIYSLKSMYRITNRVNFVTDRCIVSQTQRQ